MVEPRSPVGPANQIRKFAQNSGNAGVGYAAIENQGHGDQYQSGAGL